jgi:hypothetical protein
MKHLFESFQTHQGLRGVHFYHDEKCNFLDWKEVFSFLDSLPVGETKTFSENLIGTLSNYDPDTEFLAVQQNKGSISVELYSQQSLSRLG